MNIDSQNSPSLSLASQSRESFSTAVTSTSHTDLESSSSLPALRKSVSVDSFVRHEPIVTRPNRGNTTLDTSRGLVLDLSFLKREREQRSQQSRNRGESVSSANDPYQSSLMTDSDAERSDLLADTTIRRTSMKGHQYPKPYVRGGDLPLPARTPTLSTTSSMSSVMTSPNNHEHPHQLSTLQSVPMRALASPARVRSGSLGGVYPSPGKQIHPHTQISMDDSSIQSSTVTIVVVGVTGCGKSAVIRKGLKGFALSDPTIPLPGAISSSRYTRRIGRLTESENSAIYVLCVIEIDLSPSELDASISTMSLLPDSPRVDGVIICYDSSSAASFHPVEGLLQRYSLMRLPAVVLACKSDLEREIDPQSALEVIQQYDVGLVEVSNASDQGREKMRRSFQWLLKAIRLHHHTSRSQSDDYRNPASPDMILSPPWENPGATTPTASSTSSTLNLSQAQSSRLPPSSMPTIPASRTPLTPNSPARARSTSDLLSEHETSQLLDGREETNQRSSSDGLHRSGPTLVDVVNGAREVNEEKRDEKKEARPAQWATLDELLDKLMFLAVSGDDPTFITHFLLTYRRFANPRSVLLAMQKRMRQLDNPSGDPMFACFAQMRICHLLELWIRDYPHDFAVRGTAGALSALVKSIISKTYLLHYGSEFLPFLELLPSLFDKDVAWALKIDDSAEESDDSYSLLEDEEDHTSKSEADSTSSVHDTQRQNPKSPMPAPARERRPSLPLTAKTFNSSSAEQIDMSARQQLKDLQRVAQELNAIDSEEIAQEITRIEVNFFLKIEPRHWLQYTLVPGKKDPMRDSIARFNEISNHLAAWVVSLILCHDRAKARARQIEKFVEVAQKLRALNNYSALRAVVAGINNSTFPGDQTMEQFKARAPEQAKNLQSWDVLLQHIRSHRAYRLALRNTKGACIPALEVHMSDLIRSHEGNADFNPSDPTKVHWGKFNMMGRFISSTTQCQAQCHDSNDYSFQPRPHIEDLINISCLMNEEMQTSRIAPQEDEEYRPRSNTNQMSVQHKEAAKLRRLFFW